MRSSARLRARRLAADVDRAHLPAVRRRPSSGAGSASSRARRLADERAVDEHLVAHRAPEVERRLPLQRRRDAAAAALAGVAEEARRRAVEVAGDDPAVGRRRPAPTRRSRRPRGRTRRRSRAAGSTGAELGARERRRPVPGLPSSYGRTRDERRRAGAGEHGRDDGRLFSEIAGTATAGPTTLGREDPRARRRTASRLSMSAVIGWPVVAPADRREALAAAVEVDARVAHRLVAGVDRDRRVERRAALAARERSASRRRRSVWRKTTQA